MGFEDQALSEAVSVLVVLAGVAITLGVSSALLMVTRAWALRGLEV